MSEDEHVIPSSISTRNIIAAVVLCLLGGGVTGAMPGMIGGNGVKDEIAELRKSVEGMRTDLAVMKNEGDSNNRDVTMRLSDHEGRIRMLEQKRHP